LSASAVVNDFGEVVTMSELADRCRNRWPSIFQALGFGLSEKLLGHRNVPCPMCGGHDRFQFTDRGWGRWHCRGCGEGGDGVRLVERMKGVGFREAARLVEDIIGGVSASPKQDKGGVHPKDPMKSWRNASPDVIGSLADTYLKTRAIVLTEVEARSLRFASSLFHWKTKTNWPAMLARVTRHDGTELTTHQTFLARDGNGKAPLGEDARLFAACDTLKGGGVWFGAPDPAHDMIVAEGIESTLSAERLCNAGASVAALSASGIHFLVLPPEAKLVQIFADHDPDGKGVAAAIAACRRWREEGREVHVVRSPGSGEDANDVLRRKLGVAHA
jgi:putative DNA primase/helicase